MNLKNKKFITEKMLKIATNNNYMLFDYSDNVEQTSISFILNNEYFCFKFARYSLIEFIHNQQKYSSVNYENNNNTLYQNIIYLDKDLLLAKVFSVLADNDAIDIRHIIHMFNTITQD